MLADAQRHNPLTPASKDMTTFSAPSGHYNFSYMPFVIKKAPIVSLILMRRLLDSVPNVYHYSHALLVATDSLEEHFGALNDVLRRITEAGLTVRPSK